MRGDVGLARGGEHIFGRRVTPVTHERAAGEANDVPCAVAVVDGEDIAALQVARDFLQPAEALQVDLDPGAVFDVEAVARSIFRFLSRHRRCFDPLEAVLAPVDPHLAEFLPAPHGHVHRQRIEELVGEDGAGEPSGPVAARDIHRIVAEFRKRGRHLASARAQLNHGKLGRLAKFRAKLPQTGRDQDSEDGLNLLGGEVVALAAEWVTTAAVVAAFAVV